MKRQAKLHLLPRALTQSLDIVVIPIERQSHGYLPMPIGFPMKSGLPRLTYRVISGELSERLAATERPDGDFALNSGLLVPCLLIGDTPI